MFGPLHRPQRLVQDGIADAGQETPRRLGDDAASRQADDTAIDREIGAAEGGPEIVNARDRNT